MATEEISDISQMWNRAKEKRRAPFKFISSAKGEASVTWVGKKKKHFCRTILSAVKPRAGDGYATVAEQLHHDEVGRSYTDVEEQNSYAVNLKGAGSPGNKGYMDDVEKHTEGKTPL